MKRSRRRSALAAVTAALLTVGGCGDDNGNEQAEPASSSTTEPGPAISEPPPPSPSTTAAGDDCPHAGAVPPEGAVGVSQANADVDGDGAEDTVFAYRRSDGGRRLAVELAGGRTAAVDASANPSEGPSPLSVLGGIDLGGDGDTVAAVTGAGASVVTVGLFQFDDCSLARVTFESGAGVELPVSGAITHGDGLRCAESDGEPPLTRLSATSTDGETFTATETGYRIEGSTLMELDSRTETLTRGADDEQIAAYYTLDCPGLQNSLGPL